MLSKKKTENEQINKTLEEIKARDEARDTTSIIRYVFIITGGFLACMFVGDIFYNKTYLTAEIIHTVIGALFGYGMAIVQSHFMQKGQKQKMAQEEPNGEKPKE